MMDPELKRAYWRTVALQRHRLNSPKETPEEEFLGTQREILGPPRRTAARQTALPPSPGPLLCLTFFPDRPFPGPNISRFVFPSPAHVCLCFLLFVVLSREFWCVSSARVPSNSRLVFSGPLVKPWRPLWKIAGFHEMIRAWASRRTSNRAQFSPGTWSLTLQRRRLANVLWFCFVHFFILNVFFVIFLGCS